jgi:glycosyltransferase involved in cell wall biosynthesis
MKKIALCNRDPSGHLGGDAIQVFAYRDALIKLGYEAEYIHVLDPDLIGYDEVWLFHANMGWTVRQWYKTTQANLPYKVFAIFYPGVYSDTNHDLMNQIMYGAQVVYCLSSEEKREVLEEFPDLTNIKVINNGVNKDIFKKDGEKIEGNYLLSVGRIAGGKGQAKVVELAKEMNKDVYIIGPVWDWPMVDRMKQYEKAKILTEIPQEELAKYYRGASAYICTSESERNSLTVLEAAACGVPVVNSIHNRGSEWLSAPVVDPADMQALIDATELEIQMKKDRSSEVPSWEEIVTQILNDE